MEFLILSVILTSTLNVLLYWNLTLFVLEVSYISVVHSSFSAEVSNDTYAYFQ